MWWTWYRTPPQEAIELDNAEKAAFIRLRVLQVLGVSSQLALRSATDLPEVAYTALEELNDDDELDLYSHFVLRLAFCVEPSRWDWLVDMEGRLMKLRLQAMPPQQIVKLLAAQGFQYEKVETETLNHIISKSQRCWLNATRGSNTHYYRVPFSEVTQLVRNRTVIVSRGFCWVSMNELVQVATYHFKCLLYTQLDAMYKSLPCKRTEMERLKPLLDHLFSRSQHLTQSNQSSISSHNRQVTPENIDTIAPRHFPLCMKHLHQKLRQHHHLKYDGRVQYRMFLKGLGFTVQENIDFFRQEFTKTIPIAKFDREYRYHIRHSYGLEGARKDYTPMDCKQIIHNAAPRHGQYHGCPFKHWDTANLQCELERNNVSPNVASHICAQASRGEYQAACQYYYNTIHQTPFLILDEQETTSNLMHPNQWVHASLSGS